MLDSLKHMFGGKTGNFPAEEAIVPIKTHLGLHSITLHINGQIEGDFRTIEKYLKTARVSAYAEDRIIFWLLLQYWRAHQEPLTAEDTANNVAAFTSEFMTPKTQSAEIATPEPNEVIIVEKKEPIANSIPMVTKVPIANNNVVGSAVMNVKKKIEFQHV